MPYEVLARKWRPQQFDDVVGQDHVTQTLKNAIESKRIAHAYLFVGPRGIGKTSIARVFAKALNCEKGPTVTPCDACDSCREIAAGSSLDVLEIDGASNNGVDQVRELRETVKYLPTRGGYKIYIIDEVHMLSVGAFNALLKTLEEPPEHVKFMFATTEPQKILATIVSRCQRFDLRRISVPQIIERLKLIAQTEKAKIDEDALLAVARGAEGGLRDAESALDQLISFKGSKIQEDDVLSVFGLVSRTALESLGESILRGDVKGLITAVAQLDEAGKDLQRVVVELMEHFRNLLICIHVEEGIEDLDLMGSQIDVLRKQAELTNTARVLRIVEILGETEDQMKYALSRRTMLETALIRAGRAAVVVSLEEILKRIQELQQSMGGQADEGAAAPSESVAAVPVAKQAVKTALAAPSPAKKKTEKKAVDGDSFEKDLGSLTRDWAKVIDKIGKIAPLIKSALADTRPLRVEKDKVVVGFDPEFKTEMSRFSAPRNRKAVEHAVGGLLGRKVSAVFEVAASGLARATAVAREAQASYDAPKEASSNKKADQGKKKRDWTEEATVKEALDMFRGSIVDVRE